MKVIKNQLSYQILPSFMILVTNSEVNKERYHYAGFLTLRVKESEQV